MQIIKGCKYESIGVRMKIENKDDFKIWIQQHGFNPFSSNGKSMYLNQSKDILVDINGQTSYQIVDMNERRVNDTYISTMYEQFKNEMRGEKTEGTIPATNTEIESKPSKEIVKVDNTSLINQLPQILEDKRIITKQDIDEWKKMSTIDRLLLLQKTPKSLIKTRRGYLLPEFAGKDKKSLTDEHYQMFKYVDAGTMVQEANFAFLYEWSYCVEHSEWQGNECIVRGYGQYELSGRLFRRGSGGSCTQKGSMDKGDTMQGAISEAKKRFLKDLGINRDVYNQEMIE